MNAPKPEAEPLAYSYGIHALFAAAALQKTRRPIMNTPKTTKAAAIATFEAAYAARPAALRASHAAFKIARAAAAKLTDPTASEAAHRAALRQAIADAKSIDTTYAAARAQAQRILAFDDTAAL